MMKLSDGREVPDPPPNRPSGKPSSSGLDYFVFAVAVASIALSAFAAVIIVVGSLL